MKHISRLFTIAALAGMVMLGACEKIDPADRLIPVDPSDLPQTDRSVLVVEFTGQMCTNCPTGAQTIHNLQEVYPGKIIPVSMHPEGIYFTNWNNNRGKVQLTCELANTYYGYFGNPSSFPCISADFGDINNVIDTWGATIIEDMNKPTTVEFESVKTDFDAATRELILDYDIKALQYVPEGVNLVVWITENGIVGGQIDNGRPVFNYMHNHVLRGAITEPWGDPLPEAILPEEHSEGRLSYKLPDTWVADNCEVVLFLMNADKKVLQSACTAVVATEAE